MGRTSNFDDIDVKEPIRDEDIGADSVQTLHFFISGAQTAATGKVFFLMPKAGRIVVAPRVNAATAPTGATLIADVNKNGTTLYTTQANRPTIAIAANLSSVTMPDVTTFVENDILSLDVDQIGSSVAGSNLSFTLGVAYDLVAFE